MLRKKCFMNFYEKIKRDFSFFSNVGVIENAVVKTRKGYDLKVWKFEVARLPCLYDKKLEVEKSWRSKKVE